MVASKRASRLDVTGSLVDVNNYFYDQGWTDGLPIIPPTEDLVFEMLEEKEVTQQPNQIEYKGVAKT